MWSPEGNQANKQAEVVVKLFIIYCITNRSTLTWRVHTPHFAVVLDSNLKGLGFSVPDNSHCSLLGLLLLPSNITDHHIIVRLAFNTNNQSINLYHVDSARYLWYKIQYNNYFCDSII